MQLTFAPASAQRGDRFVARASAINLAAPLSDAEHATIDAALAHYAVLVFPRQRLTTGSLIGLARQLGRPEPATAGPNGTMPGDHLWQTHGSFLPVPTRTSLQYLPATSGGAAPRQLHTDFADARAAWDSLPAPMQKLLDGMVVAHSRAALRQRAVVGNAAGGRAATIDVLDTLDPNDTIEDPPPVNQLLVRHLPESQRTTLYLSAHAGSIVGLHPTEARELLDGLLDLVGEPRFVHTHHWNPGDLLIWDNRCTLHRGLPRDAPHAGETSPLLTLADVANTCAQRGIPLSQIG